MLQTVEQIRDAAAEILRHVIRLYANGNSVDASVALACECDPSVSSLYIHVAQCDDDQFGDPMTWSGAYVEQHGSTYEKPAWFAEFDKLNSDYFSSSNEDESGYVEIEQYFQKILNGVSVALHLIQPELAEWGFPDNIKLAVVTEDDDNEKTMYERVEAFNNL